MYNAYEVNDNAAKNKLDSKRRNLIHLFIGAWLTVAGGRMKRYEVDGNRQSGDKVDDRVQVPLSVLVVWPRRHKRFDSGTYTTVAHTHTWEWYFSASLTGGKLESRLTFKTRTRSPGRLNRANSNCREEWIRPAAALPTFPSRWLKARSNFRLRFPAHPFTLPCVGHRGTYNWLSVVICSQQRYFTVHENWFPRSIYSWPVLLDNSNPDLYINRRRA